MQTLPLLAGFIEEPFKFILGLCKVLLRRFFNESQCLHINSTPLKMFSKLFQKMKWNLPETRQGSYCLPRSYWDPWDFVLCDQTPRGQGPEIMKNLFLRKLQKTQLFMVHNNGNLDRTQYICISFPLVVSDFDSINGQNNFYGQLIS